MKKGGHWPPFLLLIGEPFRPYWWCIVATVMFGKR